MTYRQAKKQGYKPGRTAWTRGYVSRKINVDDQTVLTARGGGKNTSYCRPPTLRYIVSVNIFTCDGRGRSLPR